MSYKVCTVADLTTVLAGLPPMMEVFIDADQTTMFINDHNITVTDKAAFLFLHCSVKAVDNSDNTDVSYEEQVAKQSQRAMHMAHEMEKATKMPPMVE